MASCIACVTGGEAEAKKSRSVLEGGSAIDSSKSFSDGVEMPPSWMRVMRERRAFRSLELISSPPDSSSLIHAARDRMGASLCSAGANRT